MKTMRAKSMTCIIGIGLAAALSGCATNPSNQATVEQLLTTAEQGAVIYEALPTCSTTQKAPCSTVSGIAAVKAADNAANAAYQAWVAGTGTQAQVSAAIAALTSLLASGAL